MEGNPEINSDEVDDDHEDYSGFKIIKELDGNKPYFMFLTSLDVEKRIIKLWRKTLDY